MTTIDSLINKLRKMDETHDLIEWSFGPENRHDDSDTIVFNALFESTEEHRERIVIDQPNTDDANENGGVE